MYKIVDESFFFFFFLQGFSFKILSRSSLHFVGIRVFIVGYEMECEKLFFSKIGCISESLRDWDAPRVLVASYQLPDQARLYFLSCSDLAVLTLHLPACFTSVLHFGKSPLVSQSRVQSRITFLLHTLDQIFTLFHTQPIHYSHLNIGFLNVELQANLAQNKANTQLNKFNFTKFDNSLLKQLDLTFQVTKLIKLISIEYFISHKRD